MQGHAFLVWGAIGLLAGWLASFVVGGGGLIRYLVSGLIGSFVGGLVLQWTGISLPIATPFLHDDRCDHLRLSGPYGRLNNR